MSARKSKPCVDWQRVRELMGASIRGNSLSPKEMLACRVAFETDPERYGNIHAEEKAKAVRELNPLAN